MMGSQRQVIDLEEAEARALADGAIDSTLRELLTQRREGAGKHLWMKMNGQRVAGDAIRGRVRILTVCLLVVNVPDRASRCQVIDQTGVGSVAFRLSWPDVMNGRPCRCWIWCGLCQLSDWLRLVGCLSERVNDGLASQG